MPPAHAAAIAPAPAPLTEPAGLYLHIPFCRHICPYCDFNTYAGQSDLIPDYVAALGEELCVTAERVPPSGPSPTLFLGGGTPSLLPAVAVAELIDTARAHIGLASDAEITIEANPEALPIGYLRDLLAAGVNRLSLGVQSRRRSGLRVLGRGHNSLDADQAFNAARRAGFDNISLDFIFGWPGQTLDDWRRDLDDLLAWQPEHVSLYSLILEAGTPMELAARKGILTPVDDDTVADFYELAIERLGRAGWEHYEIANWAREPRFRSCHNQLYWRNAPYYGLGAGAHGFLNGLRASNVRLPRAYIDAVAAGRRPLAQAEEIDPSTAMGESMMLGLRLLVDGVSAAAFEARHGRTLREVYDPVIERFVAMGLLEWATPDRLRLTGHGALVANSVCQEFLL
jgi:oxygen-independent coproporphyrinogen-3 oxidase